MEVKVKLNKELAQQIITDSYRKSSQLTIEILDEILQHYGFELKDNTIYMPHQDGWTVSYKYFIDRYNSSYPKIRHAMRKLSKCNLVHRNKINTKANVGFIGSQINLKVNFEEVKNLLLF